MTMASIGLILRFEKRIQAISDDMSSINNNGHVDVDVVANMLPQEKDVQGDLCHYNS